MKEKIDTSIFGKLGKKSSFWTRKKCR